MVVNFNDIIQVFCNQWEFEKILRNNVVLWQMYVNILITLHSNNTEFKAIELLLNSSTEYERPIDVILISQNQSYKSISVRLHADVDYDYSKDPLTFIAEEPGSTVSFSIANGSYQYSADGKEWHDYTNGTLISLQDANDYVMFSAKTTNDSCSRDVYSSQFTINGKVKATGNIMSLLDKDMTRRDIPNNCFKNIFSYQGALTEMPYINADSMGSWSCHGMFRGCNRMKSTKPLSAIADCKEAYSYMFADCTSLIDASNITINISSESGMNAGTNSCRYMFANCISLVDPPIISSTTLYTECYQYMFNDCSSLQVMPILPATDLPYWSNGCYNHMFCGCSKLTSTEGFKLEGNDPGSYNSASRFTSMFEGCSSITRFVTPFRFNGHIDSMFKNCSSLRYVETGMTSFNNASTSKWLEGVPNEKACMFKCPNELSTSLNAYGRSDNTVPSEWTIWYRDEPEPCTFTKLQYLTMTDKQYIDTGIVPTDIETKMKFNMTASNLVGGLLQHADPSYYQVCQYQGDFCIGTNGKEFSAGSFILNAIHEITYNQIGTHDFIVDGNVAKTGIDNITSQNDAPLLIGGYRPNVTYDNGATIIFYGATLTDRSSGNIVRDFIPVKDDSGIVCFYDKISKAYFYNKGEGSFIPGPDVLYTELEYIECTGTQYIDCEFNESNDVEISSKFRIASKASDYLYGATQNSSKMMYNGLYEDGDIEYNWTNYSKQDSSDVIVVDQTLSNDQMTLEINNTQYDAIQSGTSNNDKQYLFACNDGQRTYQGRAQCYYFREKSNGELVRNFKPVISKNDVICMYDEVSKEFFYNAGTGDFIAGPLKNVYTELDYIQCDGNQYVDTELKLSQYESLVCETSCYVESKANNSCLLGGSITNSTNPRIKGPNFYDGNIEVRDIRCSDNNAGTYNEKEWFKLKIEYATEKYSVYKNDVLVYQADNTRSESLPDFNLWMFCDGPKGKKWLFNGKCAYYKLTQDNNLLFDFIPVKDSNGTPCMYDKVSKYFFYSQKNAFIAGSEKTK